MQSKIIWLIWVCALGSRLWLSPIDTNINAKGASVWLNILFFVVLYGYTLLTALGLGRMIGRRFEGLLTELEFNLLFLILGMTALALAMFAIGLIGWLNRLSIFGTLAFLGLISQNEWNAIGLQIQKHIKTLRFLPPENFYTKLLLVVTILIMPLLVLNSFTPVWDYDALMYHLEIPRQFLAQGKIYFIPEMFRSAYPLLGEMLFLIGLAFKADAFAKLINLTFAIVFVLSAYVFGKRFLGRETALIALGILLGTPAIPTWATWVSIDFAWAAYEFWSLYILILWIENNQKNSAQYLVLAGILSGVAVSTKYLSLLTMLILSAIIVWQSLRRFPRSTANILKNLLIFGASATLVMFPWYIKNWLLTGNPIYPLVWGGIGWDKLHVQIFNDYHHSFGVGKNWLDYLLIPYNVYFQHERFSTFLLESIHPAIWLSFVYILLKGRNQGLVLFFYSAAYYIIWVFNSQVIRFLLPSFATLSLLAGFVIHRSPSFIKKVLTSGLLGSLLLVSLVYQILLFRDYSAYLIGQKSPSEILMVAVENYQTIQYIKETLQPNEYAQFLWDGRGYYCDSRCIPDSNQNLAIILGKNSPNPQTLAHELGVKGITALSINKTDAKWFIDYHDPNRRHGQAFDYFYNIFIPACGDLIYVNNNTELYKISCP